MLRVLIYFPESAFPPAAGNTQRLTQMACSLRDLGCRVVLAHTTIDASNVSLAEGLDNPYAVIEVFHPSAPRPLSLRRWLAVGWRHRRRLRLWLAAFWRMPPLPQAWFRQLYFREDPDLVIFPHRFWGTDWLKWIDTERCSTAIDVQDVESLSRGLVREVTADLRAFAEERPHRLLDVDYYRTARPIEGSVDAEMRGYERYDWALGITAEETEIVAAQARNVRVVYLPTTFPPVDVRNTYDGPAIYVAGNNVFNQQGLVFFVREVLPLVREQAPEFALEVFGRMVPPPGLEAANIRMHGFVADLRPVYSGAGFSICPLLAGTGQKVKIVEAMAYGLPVAAMEQPASDSPLEHGRDGLVARTAAELAEHCVALWRDRGLCRRMGQAARATVARECSAERARTVLAGILESLA